MKLIKHCHELEASTSGSGIAQGALLGLVTDTRLEITHCFPFPSGTDETVDDEDFQLTMMRRLRQVNVDHQHVGWYQSSQFGNFLSPQLLESQFSYQTSIDESVCLIFGKKLKNRPWHYGIDNAPLQMSKNLQCNVSPLPHLQTPPRQRRGSSLSRLTE